MAEIKLGVLAEDKITGFRGRVTGLVAYITGCNQALLAPKCKADGTHVESQWYDLERLKVIDKKPLLIRVLEAVGPDVQAPRR